MKENMESKEGLQVYELGYLLLPSIAEDKLPSVIGKLQSIISSAGGVEIDSEVPFKQDLAYTMHKVVGASCYVVNDAYLGWIKFEVSPAEMPGIKKSVEGLDEVLRSLFIKAPRETHFTFAKAKALLAEKAAKAEAERRAAEDDSALVEDAGPVEGTVVE